MSWVRHGDTKKMTTTSFQTNPISLESLLQQCSAGKIQLPDFQRSWVWSIDRILGLIASVSSAFPIGALMTLESKSGNTLFARRPIQGADEGALRATPAELLLDGQQRLTALYQACYRHNIVENTTLKKGAWFYFDIAKSLDPKCDREDAIFSIRSDRHIVDFFGKDIRLDLSSPELEYEHMMFPVNRAFDWDQWQDGFVDYWKDDAKRAMFREFKNSVLQNFKSYSVPVIKLDESTSSEAVCLVFEKVNTGGKALDAFELLTAMYAAKGFRLRDDWLGTASSKGLHTTLMECGHAAEQKVGVLAKVSSTDFLQAIALRHTKEVRNNSMLAGISESSLPAVRASRQSLLDLPLTAYIKYRDEVEMGFKMVAKFLRQQNIHKAIDVPYQTQLVPLAAIFSEFGDRAEHSTNMNKIAHWFWCGIFGELYSSAVESRFAKDIVDVPLWLDGGPEPSTVIDGVFRSERLIKIRTRLSAAYKGIHALLMREGAKDFRSGQGYDVTVFFDEAVDIHHIFPQKWCESHHIAPDVYDTVINKTPLSYRTNRIIGGVAPSKYLSRLEEGKINPQGKVVEPALDRALLDSYLASHCIDPTLLRTDDFSVFMDERRKALLNLISKATGHPVIEPLSGSDPDDEQEEPMPMDYENLEGVS